MAGDNNRLMDIYVHDRQTGETTRVSVASDGTEAGGSNRSPSISGNGRYVAFHTYAENLAIDDANGYMDIYVHDRHTGLTERVSMASDGTEYNGHSRFASISDNGRYVAYRNIDFNLLEEEEDAYSQNYVHDRHTDQTTMVSKSADGVKANGHTFFPEISGNGQFVALDTYASNLVEGDFNGSRDIYVAAVK